VRSSLESDDEQNHCQGSERDHALLSLLHAECKRYSTVSFCKQLTVNLKLYIRAPGFWFLPRLDLGRRVPRYIDECVFCVLQKMNAAKMMSKDLWPKI